MLKEFKAFAMRGNVLDLAVALVIGAAFGKIVTSFVSDILMPPLGLLLGKVDMQNLFIDLSGTHHTTLAEAKAAGAATINYGVFINTVVDFAFVAFAVFLIIKASEQAQGTLPRRWRPVEDEAVPVLPVRHPHRRNQVRPVHVAAASAGRVDSTPRRSSTAASIRTSGSGSAWKEIPSTRRA